jgi:hypothetical protein
VGQYQRDDNVRALLEAINDAFDFANDKDTLKSIKPDSKQAEILTLMLQDVCSCCDFIRSYTRDPQFCTLSLSALLAFVTIQFSGKRTLKNIDGEPDEKVKELSEVLVKRRRAFLDQATISIEITAFQILDDIVNISTQLGSLSKRILDAGR